MKCKSGWVSFSERLHTAIQGHLAPFRMAVQPPVKPRLGNRAVTAQLRASVTIALFLLLLGIGVAVPLGVNSAGLVSADGSAGSSSEEWETINQQFQEAREALADPLAESAPHGDAVVPGHSCVPPLDGAMGGGSATAG